MARGESGRIVLEIEPSDKEQLHSAVRKDGLTLKEWFVQQMHNYLHGSRASEESGSYKTKQKSGRGRVRRVREANERIR
jgi:hypothetical protein